MRTLRVCGPQRVERYGTGNVDSILQCILCQVGDLKKLSDSGFDVAVAVDLVIFINFVPDASAFR